MQLGKASLRFEHPALVASWASVAGKKEGQGPLADEIDVKEQDEMFGMENWEQEESAMQKQMCIRDRNMTGNPMSVYGKESRRTWSVS